MPQSSDTEQGTQSREDVAFALVLLLSEETAVFKMR